jgi:hypothetical protein
MGVTAFGFNHLEMRIMDRKSTHWISDDIIFNVFHKMRILKTWKTRETIDLKLL